VPWRRVLAGQPDGWWSRLPDAGSEKLARTVTTGEVCHGHARAIAAALVLPPAGLASVKPGLVQVGRLSPMSEGARGQWRASRSYVLTPFRALHLDPHHRPLAKHPAAIGKEPQTANPPPPEPHVTRSNTTARTGKEDTRNDGRNTRKYPRW
jgi:hypothetical protein